MTNRYDDDDDELDHQVLRPFIVTRGRTRASAGVAMESLVDRRASPDDAIDGLESTQRQIWDVLAQMMSVAEISALVELPLGVVLVLVSDMAESDVLEVYQTAALDDIHLVRKLIDGVRAL
ncbi:MAG: DUF742 domain-containing protein [Acidimicrobiia bacterium]|nr:DUF742 domain-containing protein [Acidimicrobiia bacterium]